MITLQCTWFTVMPKGCMVHYGCSEGETFTVSKKHSSWYGFSYMLLIS